MKQKILKFFLALCLILFMTSCEGRSYAFYFSLEELQNELVSIEIVAILDENIPIVCDTVCWIEKEEERQDILVELSEIEFIGITTPRSYNAKYGFKLNYPDKCIIISEVRVCLTDNNLNIMSPKEDYRQLYYNEKVATLLKRYISSIEK